MLLFKKKNDNLWMKGESVYNIFKCVSVIMYLFVFRVVITLSFRAYVALGTLYYCCLLSL